MELDSGAKLLVISDENEMLDGVRKARQQLRLGNLRSLFDQND